MYVLPSAFDLNNIKNKIFQEYSITPSESFEQCIVDKIKKLQDNRPIIVFFKELRELSEFLDSPQYKSL
jgi:hypothetical protein